MDTQSSQSLRQQGIQALREQRLDEAIDFLTRAVAADARDAEAQSFLGVAHCQKGSHAAAQRALEQAVALEPGNAQHRFNLGVALERAGDRQGAAVAFQETLRLQPEHPKARARLQALGPAQAPQPGAPGAVPCPNCRQSSRPGYFCEWCGASLEAARESPSAPASAGATAASPSAGGYQSPLLRPEVATRFDRDRFLVNQKVLSLGNKYYIYDDTQAPLFFVDRPILKIRAPIDIYEDDSKSRKLLSLQPASFWEIINLNFTLKDSGGQVLATFRRQGWLSMLRRTWKIYDAQNRYVAIVEEDNWWKAIAQRVLAALDLDFLRTNFHIRTPDGRKLGEFLRRWTLTDKYVLDVSADTARQFDRHIAVGLALLLDNAERR